jgi:hypothetical protein
MTVLPTEQYDLAASHWLFSQSAYLLPACKGLLLLLLSFTALPAARNAPTTIPVAKTTAEDTPVDINLAGLVSDPDAGDSLVLSIQTPPARGIIAQRVTATGTTWQYTPDANYNGADSFVYKVTDGSGAFNTALVSLTVTPGDCSVKGACAAAVCHCC